MLARYDKATQLWIDRMDRITRARREWSRTRRLPPADSVGIRAPKIRSHCVESALGLVATSRQFQTFAKQARSPDAATISL